MVKKSIYTLFVCLCLSSGFAQKKHSGFTSANDPNWAKTAIWYQIFPERFRNGDPKNDPTIADIKGAYPHDLESPFQTHPWTSDWYALQPYEKQNGKSIWYNIQRRRYGGDLQGIINQLDYLEDLGINAIYLNPIFVSPSSHKYDAASYHHVDPSLGPDPVGDQLTMLAEDPNKPDTWNWTKADKLVLKLIKECHKRQIYIIFDGVFNHTGINFFAFKDVERNGAASPYKDWYTINAYADKDAGKPMDYKAWFGVKELPELRKENGTLAKGPKNYIFACTKRWMDPDGNGNPSDGIDGWRLDVAYCIPHTFWKEWHKVVRNINPYAYTTAEVVQKPEQERDYVVADEFAATMNYNFAMATFDYFISDKTRIKVSEFDYRLMNLRNIMGDKATAVMQNLYGSHDTNRFLSALVNKDREKMSEWGRYFGWSQVEKNNSYDTRKPYQGERVIQKLMAIFQMTYIGAPMIYYGDEVGMWGANDPDCRKPMLWEDLKYEEEKTMPDQTTKRPDRVAPDLLMRDFYKKLIAFRKAHPALMYGNYKTILLNDEQNIFGFVRTFEDEAVYVLLNNSEKTQITQVTLPKNQTYRDIITGDRYETTMETRTFALPPKNGLILVREIYFEKK